jgi:hypothetical protein
MRLWELNVYFRMYDVFPQSHGDYGAPRNRPRPRGGLEGPRVVRASPPTVRPLPLTYGQRRILAIGANPRPARRSDEPPTQGTD